MKHHIELEVVTPLSIGSGNENEWVPGADFVIKDKKVYVLDLQKAVKNGADLNKLTNLFIKTDSTGICNLLGNGLEEASKYIFKAPATTSNPIKSFVRTQLFDKPIITGSSLKGAVRSALFKYLRTTERDNESVFGKMKDGTDFMRFIQISDFEMPSSIIVNSKLFNLRKEDGNWYGGWKHKKEETTENYKPDGFNTLYECIEPHQKGFGSINLNTDAFDVLFQRGRNVTITYPNEKVDLIHDNISKLFMVINKATKKYLEKERAFFLNYSADRTGELVDNIDYLLSLIPDNNYCCLMKMSAGVGFHSITGDWQYSDYSNTGIYNEGKNKGKHKYKSRKIAEYEGNLQLMGFVKLREITEAENIVAMTSIQNRHEACIEEILSPILANEAAEIEAEQQREQRKKEQEEHRQKEISYQKLIEEANNLCIREKWDEALSKAQEASYLFPERPEHGVVIERCNRNKMLGNYIDEVKREQDERFCKPLEEIIGNITSIGNLTGTITKWLKFDSSHSIKETEYQAILNRVTAFKTIAPKEWKVLSKKRKDFAKAIGEEWTDKLFLDLYI